MPLGLLLAGVTLAADLANLTADRAAIERVYHSHRSGTPKTFEETLPTAQIVLLVKLDARKEAALQSAYKVEITPAMVAAELTRITTTTRAPEILAEIQAALGYDPARFARAMARAIVVERLLRARFENDDTLHAPQRREAEAARAALMAGKPLEKLDEVTWQLGPRPEAEVPAAAPVAPIATKASAASAAYSNEATTQLAQPLAPPAAAPDQERRHFLGDLPAELQRLLKLQLKQAGDVSAVIESPNGFTVFRCVARDAATLQTAAFSLPKRDYDAWLAQKSFP
ncbi:MAG: hypothetical protein WCJ14_14765 [Verrucomicrobiota bacterium]